MTRESPWTLAFVCLVGSAAIAQFMALVAWGLGIEWTAREAGLTTIVCAAFCCRVVSIRRAYLAERRTDC